MRPRLLDLFCSAGGAAVGYHRAGFDVAGVDIEPQPNYPFEFHQADALEFLIDGFDVIHASPPCQHASWSARRWLRDGRSYPDLIAATRARLLAAGVPYVIENVVASSVRRDLILTGEMFGLSVIRRRVFELSGFWVMAPLRAVAGAVKGGHFCTVAGHGGDGSGRFDRWCAAMEIDWMSKLELTQAIPPAYTEHIGRFALAALRAAA